ncbi:MAG: BlaI/MecI/CopY family transcriptional regulator [Oscillospiraceae bacterium]|nr:BlaI/MecI/CopY family transcriptional regulator [Oscillospiraceae bacterium]
MKAQIFDSELKIMELLWTEGDTTAKALAQALVQQVGWSKTTTYTVIKKCVDKGFVERRGENFLCHALISKAEVQRHETTELVDKMFDGSSDLLVASLIQNNKMSPEQLQNLRNMLEDLE